MTRACLDRKTIGHSHKISTAQVPTAFRFSTTSTTGREREAPPVIRDPVEGYPLALSYLRDLRDPETVASRTRHYRFHPLWGGASPTGAMKNDKLTFTRAVGSTEEYRFRVCERSTQGAQAVLYLTAQGLLPNDEITVELNGTKIHNLQRVFHPDGRLETFGRPLPPFSSVWFNLNPKSLNNGDNRLKMQLTHITDDTNNEVVIDEVEVMVMPA